MCVDVHIRLSTAENYNKIRKYTQYVKQGFTQSFIHTSSSLKTIKNNNNTYTRIKNKNKDTTKTLGVLINKNKIKPHNTKITNVSPC